MKLSKRQLKRIIREEKQKLIEAATHEFDTQSRTMSSSSDSEVALENAVLNLREELYKTAGFSRTEANEAIIQEVQAILMQ